MKPEMLFINPGVSLTLVGLCIGTLNGETSDKNSSRFQDTSDDQ